MALESFSRSMPDIFRIDRLERHWDLGSKRVIQAPLESIDSEGVGHAACEGLKRSGALASNVLGTSGAVAGLAGMFLALRLAAHLQGAAGMWCCWGFGRSVCAGGVKMGSRDCSTL